MRRMRSWTLKEGQIGWWRGFELNLDKCTCEDCVYFFDKIGSGCSIEVTSFRGIEIGGLVRVVIVLDEGIVHRFLLPHDLIIYII